MLKPAYTTGPTWVCRGRFPLSGCRAVAFALTVALIATPLAFASGDADDLTFADLSIEELLNTKVTSVAGVENSLLQTPAAVTAVTREDIFHSGHLSLPEALRIVPGVYVAHTDSNTWSVGTRGFNAGFGNKQLVLIDGRTTYDLLFSGTFWDVQEVMLEDLDRIEVIRGPGATLWGANAVNGVINITTRSARDTQGSFLNAGSGSYEKLFGQARYGGQLGDNSWFRVWGKHAERGAFEFDDLPSGNDQWRMSRGGFRFDVERDDGLNLTLQGDGYDGELGELNAGVPTDGWARGYNVLARIARGDNQSRGWQLQAYFDRSMRNTSGGFEVDRDTVDVDFRRYFEAGRHSAIAGAGFRVTRDQTRAAAIGAGNFFYNPASRSAQTLTAFVQDTVTLRPGRMFVMLGSKIEHNDFSGIEIQPSVRAWWTPSEQKVFWAAVSRPVRTPSRTDANFGVDIPGVLTFTGNPDIEAERMTAFEAGFRQQLSAGLTLDIAAFHQDYRNLVRTTGPQTALTFDNAAAAESSGVEISGEWHTADRWHLQGSYSYLNMRESNMPVDEPDGSAPRQMVKMFAGVGLTRALNLHTSIYWVDNLARSDVDAYVRLDLGLRWQMPGGMEVRVGAQNLLDKGLARSLGDYNSESPRSAYLELSFRN